MTVQPCPCLDKGARAACGPRKDEEPPPPTLARPAARRAAWVGV